MTASAFPARRFFLLAALAAATACATAPAIPPSPAGPRVNGATALGLVHDGAVLVDVRRADEFDAGHVPGAINVPYDQLDARAGEIGPATVAVVVYCRSGRRSAVAAETLRSLGYRKVFDLGPMAAWPSEAAAKSQ